jgi:hypothetical protein
LALDGGAVGLGGAAAELLWKVGIAGNSLAGVRQRLKAEEEERE